MTTLPARCTLTAGAPAPEHGGRTRWRHLVCSLWVLAMAGCHSPNGNAPAPIAWDRDTCAHCGMTISDRGYAAEVWVEAEHRHYKFDDIGCMVSWLRARGASPGQLKLWVADYLHHDDVHWLDARTAWYHDGLRTPMDYGFGAMADATQGAVDFDTASARMLERDEKR